MQRSTSKREVALLLRRSGGMVRLRDHPDLRRAILHLAECGLLTTLYPGVYVRPAERDDTDLRIRAAALWRPDAVVVGRGAARVGFWPDLPVTTVELAVADRQRPQSRVRFVQRAVPPAWRWRRRGVTITRPALTAVDLVPEMGGAAISKALNRRVTMDELWSAVGVVAHRRGHRLRRRILHDYRDGPWSEAEQELHRLLRAAGIHGWIANLPIEVRAVQHPLDVVFEELKVVIEVDGYEYHKLSEENRERYEIDRYVASELVGQGWLILRFTWRQLVEQPEWVIATIRATLRRAARR